MKKLLLALTALLLNFGVAFGQSGVPGGVGMGLPVSGPGVQVNLNASAAPTVNNDLTQGYQVGSLWQNSNTGQFWIARSVAAGAAVWNMLELSDHPGYIANSWYIGSGIIGFSSGVTPGSGSIRLYPAYIKQRVTLSSLAVRINTLSAGGNIQAAIYANNPATGKPTGNALASTASISTSATGTVSSAASVQLEPGLYWWATNCDNGTAVFEAIAPTGTVFPATIGTSTLANILQSTNQAINGLTVTQTFGTWPSLTAASFTEVSANSLPVVAFQVQSIP